MKKIVTESATQTKKLGLLLAQELRGGEVICLDGDLGAGKTTFTQGLLKGLGAKGPYTSPTFLIMKEYKLQPRKQNPTAVYHIDAYRIGADDLLELGWKEITNDQRNVIIVEWSDRIKKILPEESLRIQFSWIDEKKRKLEFSH